MADHSYAAAHHALGGSDSKPPKVISHIVHRKSANGDHIFEHHHTHPDHHPKEEHTKRGDDEMVEHMMQHAGTPNPGEAEADAGTPDAGAPQDASAGAGPSLMGSGAASPGAGAAAMAA